MNPTERNDCVTPCTSTDGMVAVTDSETPPSTFTCATCKGAPLVIYKTRRPTASTIIRYRRCDRCGYRCSGLERPLRALPPRPPRSGEKL